jgi:hypothetical protein
MEKWTNELNRNFSKEEVYMAKKHIKEFLYFTGHKGNANQNYTKISLTLVRMAIIKNINSKR